MTRVEQIANLLNDEEVSLAAGGREDEVRDGQPRAGARRAQGRGILERAEQEASGAG